MPQFQPSTLTVFAVLITEPVSMLPPELTVGLTVACAIGATIALLGGFHRDGWKRKVTRDAMPQPPSVLRTRSERAVSSHAAAA